MWKKTYILGKFAQKVFQNRVFTAVIFILEGRNILHFSVDTNLVTMIFKSNIPVTLKPLKWLDLLAFTMYFLLCYNYVTV